MSDKEKDIALYFVSTASERECKQVLKDLVKEKQVESNTLLQSLERNNVIQINSYPRTQHK